MKSLSLYALVSGKGRSWTQGILKLRGGQNVSPLGCGSTGTMAWAIVGAETFFSFSLFALSASIQGTLRVGLL